MRLRARWMCGVMVAFLLMAQAAFAGADYSVPEERLQRVQGPPASERLLAVEAVTRMDVLDDPFDEPLWDNAWRVENVNEASPRWTWSTEHPPWETYHDMSRSLPLVLVESGVATETRLITRSLDLSDCNLVLVRFDMEYQWMIAAGELEAAYSLDDGASWVPFWTAAEARYMQVEDGSFGVHLKGRVDKLLTEIANQPNVLISFKFKVGAQSLLGQTHRAVLDNVLITKYSGTPDDFTASLSVDEVHGPAFDVKGVAARVAAVGAKMGERIASAVARVGRWNGTAVENEQQIPLERSYDPQLQDAWVGELPDDAAAPGEQVVWKFVFTDIFGGTEEYPADDWYTYYRYSDDITINDERIPTQQGWTLQAPWEYRDTPPPSIRMQPFGMVTESEQETMQESGPELATPVFATNADGPYPASANARLMLQQNVTMGPNGLLGLRHELDTPDNVFYGPSEGYQMQVSVDGGGWQRLDPVGGYPYDNLAALGLGQRGFGAQSDGVESVIFDLSAYDGHQLSFALWFGSDSGPEEDNGDGVRIHSVLLTGGTPSGNAVDGYVFTPTTTASGRATMATGTPLENMVVEVFASGADVLNDPPIRHARSAADGYYRLFPLDPGDVTVRVAGNGEYLSSIEVTGTVGDGVPYSEDIPVDPVGTSGAISGEVQCSQTATPLPGVEILFRGPEDVTATADGSGSFTTGDISPGGYEVFTAPYEYSTGVCFHSHQFTVLDAPSSGNVLKLDPIEAPAQVNVSGGDGAAVVNTVAPVAALSLEELSRWRDHLVRRSADAAALSPDERRESQELLLRIEDAIGDYRARDHEGRIRPMGYRVRIDGVLRPEVYQGPQFTVKGLQNGLEVELEVAVEYGYGDEFLVFSPGQFVIPEGYIWELTPVTFNWVELRPSLGGSGTACVQYDDSEGTVYSFLGAGNSFSFYGMEYTELHMFDDGTFTFDPDGSLPWWPGLGDPTDPNPLFAPFWVDFAPTYGSEEVVWGWHDSANNRYIIQWSMPIWTDYSRAAATNATDVQAIIDGNSGTIIYQYKTAFSGWDSDAIIGAEGVSGEVGWTMTPAEITDNMALEFTPRIPSYGTVVVTLNDDAGSAVSGARVYVDGHNRPQAVTGESGKCKLGLPPGTYDLDIRHPDFWPATVTEIAVTVDQTSDLPVITMLSARGTANVQQLVLNYDISAGGTAGGTFTLENTGSGELEYRVWLQPGPTRATFPDWAPQSRITVPIGGDGLRAGPSTAAVISPEGWGTNLMSFNASTTSGYYNLAGVAVSADGIFLGNEIYGDRIHEFDHQGNYVGHVSPPEGIELWNDFGWNANTDMFYSVSGDGAVYRFRGDLSVLEHIYDLDHQAAGCAYNWYTDELFLYEPGVPMEGTPEAFFRLNPVSGELRELMLPSADFGICGAIAFVPDDPQGLTIYGLFNLDGKGIIHRYNTFLDYWETNGVLLIDGLETEWHLGMEVTNALPVSASAAKRSPQGIAAGYRLNFVTTTLDDATGATVVNLWEGLPGMPMLDVTPAQGTLAATGNQATVNVAFDPSRAPDWTPVAGDSVKARLAMVGPHWVDAPVVEVTVYITQSSGVGERAGLPERYRLHPNHPNPFNPATQVRFDLMEPQPVTLTVYNLMGQEVGRLIDGRRMEAGYHSVTFDGSHLASGVYFLQLDTPVYRDMKKMVLVK